MEVIGLLDRELEVTTASCYFRKLGFYIDSDEEFSEDFSKEYNAIQNIISVEVSYYLTRRTSGLCGSVCDNLWSLRRAFIDYYELSYGKQFIDFNKNIDF